MKSLLSSIIVVTLAVTLAYSQQYASVKDSLLHVIDTSQDLSLKGYAHIKVARQYITTDMKTARAHLDSALQLFERQGDSVGYANVFYNSGILYRFSSDYNKAEEEFYKVQDHATQTKDTFELANGLFQLGVVDHLRGNYNHSIANFRESFSNYEQINDSLGMAYVLNSIGIVYNDLNMDSLAIINYNKAADIWKATADTLNLANTYNNIGISHFETGNSEEAMRFYEMALTINQSIDNHWGTALTTMNIGELFMQQGDYEGAIPLLKDAYIIQKRENYKQKLAETLSRLGESYLYLGLWQQSQAALEEGLASAGDSKAVLSEIHHAFAKLYKELGDHSKALSHFEKYSSLKDSIFQEDNQRNVNQLLVQFEAAQKDKEIANNELQIKEQQVALMAKQTQYTYALIGVIVLLVIIAGLWFLYRQKQRLKSQEIDNLKKQKEIEVLGALISGEERERKRLAQDLHDGINGDLSVIKQLVSTIDTNKLNGNAKKNQSEALEMLDTSCEQVRFISHNLAPSTLRDFNLLDALRQYCFRMSRSHKMQIDFQFVGDPLTLNLETETTIFRMIQELVYNIVKHAQATEALVQITHYDRALHITVEDNGKGFNLEQAEDGLGIQSVKSRVNALNGTFNLTSVNGTTIEIDIDLTKTTST